MAQTESVEFQIGRIVVQGNTLIVAAISVVALGLGVGFYAQLGMPAWAALGCTAMLFAGLFSLHVAVLRGRRVAELELMVGQLLAERSVIAATSGEPAATAAQSVATEPISEFAVPARRAPLPSPAAQVGKPAIHDGVDVGATTSSGVDGMATNTGAPVEYDAQAQFGERSAPAQPAPRPLDAETIHALVKKLAILAAAPAPVPTPRSPDIEDRPNVADTLPQAVATGAAITESVRALRATADAMRSPPEAVPGYDRSGDERAFDAAFAPRPDSTALPEGYAPDQETRLSAFAEALSADRIDVLLEPVLGLKDQSIRHYEVSFCLRAPDGARLDPSQDRRALGGTGILPLIDLAKIARIAEVARLLAERGKTGAVFAGLAGESLSDDDFLQRFSDICAERMAITDQLVVALAQEDVRTFAPAHWGMLQELSAAGFRFALEHVTDLDMDFDTLRAANIEFVKLDAEVYLQGLGAGHGAMVPAAEVYRFLATKGLSLIVDHISNEAQLTKIVDCGALYGQGQLFGGARPIKAQALSARSAA